MLNGTLPGRHRDTGEPLPWTAYTVGDALKSAAQTLRAIPIGSGDYPSQSVTFWPEIVRDTAEAFGYTDVSVRLPCPTPAQIDDLDIVLPWLLWVEGDTIRQLVWLRAQRFPWPALVEQLGYTRQHWHPKLFAAHQCIADRLNAPARG